MPKKTKAALHVAARERALHKAAEFHARHENLVKLAEEYFLAGEEREAIMSEASERIRQIEKKADADASKSDQAAASVVRKMMATGEPKAAVAQRLDLTGAALKRALDTHGDAAADPMETDAENLNKADTADVTDGSAETASQQPAA